MSLERDHYILHRRYHWAERIQDRRYIHQVKMPKIIDFVGFRTSLVYGMLLMITQKPLKDSPASPEFFITDIAK